MDVKYQPPSVPGGNTLWEKELQLLPWKSLWTEVFNAVKKAFGSVIKLPVLNNTLAVDYQLCFDMPRKKRSNG
ncbi:hypothetical protein M5K25_018320 [Dendrobium thyrsiflorum]|uniref:Uncharacterized protein n=1 Tax=Dendrobium thyrsiflorum TaxID=117978 RepID=A0ABD0UI50_DENTH